MSPLEPTTFARPATEPLVAELWVAGLFAAGLQVAARQPDDDTRTRLRPEVTPCP